MKNTFLYILLFVCVLINPSTAYAESPAKAVREGNAFYKQGEYDKAVRKYLEAKEISPDSDIANFNLGTALFMKGEFQESVDAFTRSLNTENTGLEADAAYNIANAKYKLGSGLAESDMHGAADLYREALDYYKRANELDEKNADAKYNYELVERELKILLDKIKNQPQQQQSEDEDRKQDGEEKKQESRPAESEQQKDEEEKGRRQGEKEEDNAKAGTEEKAENQESGEEDASSGEEESGEMSPEEARMLLDAFAEEEVMDNLRKMKKGYNAEVLKDW